MIELVNVYSDPNAETILYQLLRERDSGEYFNISHRWIPTWDNHLSFIKSKPYRYWYIVYIDHEPVGSVYLTKLNEIGIFLFRASQRKGHGLNILDALTRRHKPLKAISGRRSGRYLANIHPDNARSIKLFSKLGFTLKQVTYEL